jgi:hypothetical protein
MEPSFFVREMRSMISSMCSLATRPVLVQSALGTIWLLGRLAKRTTCPAWERALALTV